MEEENQEEKILEVIVLSEFVKDLIRINVLIGNPFFTLALFFFFIYELKWILSCSSVCFVATYNIKYICDDLTLFELQMYT